MPCAAGWLAKRWIFCPAGQPPGRVANQVGAGRPGVSPSGPDTYKKIAKLLDERRLDRLSYIEQVLATLRNELAGAGLHADVAGRPKHIYSIWKKMRKNLDFSELYDIRAVRILVDSIKDCYTALGLIHSLWQPVPGEFDDYINQPKANDYKSLHTAVIGPEDKVVEVQIRTFEMHEHAEFGVAAHWRCKEGGRATPPTKKNRLAAPAAGLARRCLRPRRPGRRLPDRAVCRHHLRDDASGQGAQPAHRRHAD